MRFATLHRAIDQQNAKEHAANESDGRRSQRDALGCLPPGKSEVLQNTSESCRRAVTSGKAHAELTPERAVQAGFRSNRRDRQVDSEARNVLHGTAERKNACHEQNSGEHLSKTARFSAWLH